MSKSYWLNNYLGILNEGRMCMLQCLEGLEVMVITMMIAYLYFFTFL